MKKFNVFIDVGKLDPLVSVFDGADEDDVREQVEDYIAGLQTQYDIRWRVMRIEEKRDDA